ncbi:MAG: Clp protease N-terminal domain-containing protein [Candidatus Dormiibacterota bacterium]
MYPFQRFTEQAKAVLMMAQDEAEKTRHSYIGTEHLLLGLLRVSDGVAAEVLTNLGVDIDTVRDTMDAIVGRSERTIVQQIIPTSRVKKVIEFAFDQAKEMGDEPVGTVHLLIGLLREADGIAAQVLRGMGVEVEVVLTNLPDRKEEAADEAVSEEAGHTAHAVYSTLGPAPAATLPWFYGDPARFTAEAKTALAIADEEGVKRGRGEIGTEHLLAGLIRQGEGRAAQALRALGITLERVRSATGSVAIALPAPPSPVPTLTLRRAVWVGARKQAEGEGLSLVDTEHLLLSLSDPQAEPAAGILRDLGASPPRIAEALARFPGEPPG